MQRPHPYAVHPGGEGAGSLDDLAHQGDVERLDVRPRGVPRVARNPVLHQPGVDHFTHRRRRLLRTQAAHVLGHPPELLVGDDPRGDHVTERGHRSTVQAGPEPAIDVLGRSAAVEQPGLGEIRGPDGNVPVIGQRGRRATLTPPRLTVALETLELVVDRRPFRNPLVRDAGGTAEIQRFGRAVLEEPGKRLEVRHDVVTLPAREPGAPAGHGRPRHALVDHPKDVLIRGKLATRRGADLVEGPCEIPGWRQHEGGGRAVARSGLTVTLGAPFVVNDLAPFRILGPEHGAGSKQPGAAEEHQQAPTHPQRVEASRRAAASHPHFLLPAPRSLLPAPPTVWAPPPPGRTGR